MSILRGFMPFILWWILGRQIPLQWALWVSAGVAVIEIARTLRERGPEAIKLLDGCSTALFVGLAVYVTLANPQVSPFPIHMAINGGLAVIAIGSMLVGKPFTLQYAREQVSPELWNSPLFLRTNYRITAVWCAAFIVQTLTSAAQFKIAGFSQPVALAISLAAMCAALAFTIAYPKRVRARARARAAST